MRIVIAVFISILELVLAQKQWAVVGNPLAFFRPCEDNENITVVFEPNLAPEEENQYLLKIFEDFGPNFKVVLKFDSDATLTLLGNASARVGAEPEHQRFRLDYYKKTKNFNAKVQGPPFGGVPYIQSIKVNSVEYCGEPKTGYLDSYIKGTKLTAEISTSVPDDSCGRRKVQHTELIVNGLPTKHGDWPWHAAIYRLEGSRIDYICGGTLLSKVFVLTAAHCVTSRGTGVLPETRNVILGKYNLVGGDEPAVQEKEVNKITVHKDYKHDRLDNDIALMKLKSEVVYSDYVQPACQWYADAYKKLPGETVYGTVVGWGFDQTDALSPTLQQVTIPKRSESTCIKSKPLFYSRLLNNQKFCAGYTNGTSACNGDSGGGFLVFVPDTAKNTAPDASGAWYVRGIVSLSYSRSDAPICDPHYYTIFTDLAKFGGWLRTNMV